ncbi:RING-H2 finger protein ATL5 [Spatholobus suberectus]|nr:RING-H2 finger protein ATL5 [Spatholobus suberectus]
MTMDPVVESKYAHNGKVMVGTAILLFIIILIIILFQTYVRFCRRRRRRQFSHSLPANSSATPFSEPCLDPSVIKSLPTFTFSAASHRSTQDCAVCLSEFADGDEGRVLPNCNHAFHAHCIDTWFASHSTCPLCRTPVQPATGSADTEPGSDSVSEPGEACSSSSLPAPIGCPRKPLGIILEVPEVERGSDTVTGDQGFRWSLKRFCSV